MAESIGLSRIAELGTRTLASSAEAIAAAGELVQRVTGVDITVVSEVTSDGRYVFRSIEKRTPAPVQRDDALPWEWSLCSRVHAGESPATVTDTLEVPALWASWLRLKQQLGVDWDVRAFCTREVRLPDGTLFGTLCLHHLEPRSFAPDEEALVEIVARLLGQEVWRERAAAELRSAVEEIELSEQRRVELAEELRHELRAPLQVIDGYAEAMLDGVIARDDDHVVLVRSESTRAMRLLDDLVGLVRIESNADAGDATEIVDAAAVVTEMCARLEPLADAIGVTVTLAVEEARVEVSRRRIEQFVVNLVRNALRSLDHGGGAEIKAFVRRDGDAVVIGVEDDGPGLPPEELERVFERFYRGSSGRDAGPGSGLGLTVARRIVEAAGGTVCAESVQPHGFRVLARLPLAR